MKSVKYGDTFIMGGGILGAQNEQKGLYRVRICTPIATAERIPIP
jgi:hypothetical protein